MRFLADLHIHSRFSRATSRQLTLPQLHIWAQRKGLSVLGTGDITHPEWIEEVAEQLVPAEEGLFRLRPELARAADEAVSPACRREVRFLLQGEVSSIYKHGGVVRKVHNVVFCPDLPAARRFLGALDRIGNIRSDGRPNLGLPARDVLEVLLQSGTGAHLVPAHVWTPWFSVLGSKSGYDSVDACFEDLAGEVFALETGLSSDPPMNWRVSSLDRFALISNSDAHSPSNLGREANEFECPLSYREIFEALRLSTSGDRRFLGTLEFFPEEGKYHLDGHRKCEKRMTPEETRGTSGRCPSCGALVTVGVLHRVEELADRAEGARPAHAKSFGHLVPLPEVLAECFDVGATSGRVKEACERLCANVGPELFILREAPLEEVERRAGSLVAEAVRRVREGRLHIASGYDGEFGTIRIFEPEERRELGGQTSLFASSKGDADLKRDRLTSGVPLPEVRGSSGIGEARGDREGGVHDLLDGLNPEQREAVLAPAGPLAIQAGPGTGKTRTLTHRIAFKVLSGSIRPEDILAVTFTNRAAAEMTERLSSLLGSELSGRATVCTLHRLGLRILRGEAASVGLRPDFPVLGREECLSLLSAATGLRGREARRALDDLSLLGRDGSPSGQPAGVRAAYVQALRDAGAVDVDGLILLPVRLLSEDAVLRSRWQGKYGFIAVDEFQDLDPMQYRLVELLAPEGADVTVIGDPDQAIYGFRGAAPGLFRRFLAERPGAGSVALTHNYRSTPAILGAAVQALTGGDSNGRGVVAVLPDGPRVWRAETATDLAEADFVAREVVSLLGGTSHLTVRSARKRDDGERAFSLADVAVLYRLKAQRRNLEDALGRAGIPCSAVGEEPTLLRGRGKEVMRRLRQREGSEAASPAVEAALVQARIADDHPAAAAWRSAAAASDDVASLLERAVLERPDDGFMPRAERVALLTLHAAKGLEFPVVFATGCEEGILPQVREGEAESPEGVAEECRLLYVGMTRAQRLLYLTSARSRFLHGRRRSRPASRFLSAVSKELLDFRASPDGRAAESKPKQLKLL